MAATKGLPQSVVVSSKQYHSHPVNNKLFSLHSLPDTLSANSYYLNDPVLKDNIKTALYKEMQNLGFTAADINFNIAVTFTVLDAPARLYEFNRYNSHCLNLCTKKNACLEKTNYNIEPGTVIITLTDAGTRQKIWEGFASGAINTKEGRKNKHIIDQTIQMILQEYAFINNSIPTQ